MCFVLCRFVKKFIDEMLLMLPQSEPRKEVRGVEDEQSVGCQVEIPCHTGWVNLEQ